MWYQHAIVCAKHFANIVPYHLQEGKNLYMKEEIELNKTWISLLKLSSDVFGLTKCCTDSPLLSAPRTALFKWITAIVCDLLGNGLKLLYTS